MREAHKYLFILLASTWAIVLSQRPIYNFDMLGYIGVALEKDGYALDEVHTRTYAIAKSVLPEDDFTTIISGDYREKCKLDARYFHDRLTLYRVKPVYNGLVYMFHKMGFNLVQATYLPSNISFVLMATIFFLWIRRHVQNKWLCMVIASLICFFNPLVTVGRLATPDAVSHLCVLFILYLLYLQKHKFIIYAFMIISFLIRIDNVIFGLFVIMFIETPIFRNIYLFFSKKFITLLVVVSLALVALFLLIPTYFGNDDFWLFSFPPYASIKTYFSFARQMVFGFSWSSFPLLLSLILITLFSQNSEYRQISVMVITVTIIRLILFPYMLDRFFVSFYLLFIVSIIAVLSLDNKSQLNNTKSSRSE